MDNLRVIHLIPGMHGGGAERQLALLSQHLCKKGVDVHVGYCVDGDNTRLLEKSGCEIHKLSPYHFYDPRLGGQIKKLIRDIKPDVVMTWLEPMDIAGGKAAMSLKIPWVICERSRGPFAVDQTVKGWLRKQWRIKLARKASMIVCNSQPARDNWSKRVNVSCGRVSNIIDTDCAVEDPADTNLPENRPVIVMAGRLEHPKNYSFALDALADVDAEVFIFGKGKLEHSLKRHARRMRITDRVHFRGYTRDWAGWLKRCDLFVNTSIYEGCSNAILQAVACGCPAIISDIPAHQEFSPAGVVLGDISDPILFADQIKSALDKKVIPDKTFLRRFEVDSVVQEYLEIFKKAAT